MKAYIYKIKRKDNKFEVYIGQTIQKLKYRLTAHINGHTNKEFKEWLNKYGKENIEIITIEEYDYIDIKDIENILNERENYWSEFYKNNENYKCFTLHTGSKRNNNKYYRRNIEINGIKYNSVSEYYRNGGS